MADLPTFGDAADAASRVRQRGRTLLPWLPDPPACPACGTLQHASAAFDPREVIHVTTWHCRECDDHRPRDPVYGEAVLDGPRRLDARTIGDLLNE